MHGITEPVWCRLPSHMTVCSRHQTWIGPAVKTVAQQRDLNNNSAQHRHRHRAPNPHPTRHQPSAVDPGETHFEQTPAPRRGAKGLSKRYVMRCLERIVVREVHNTT